MLTLAALIATRAALLVPLAATGVLTVAATLYLAIRRGLRSPVYRVRSLSPERVATYKTAEEESSPERLARSITERAAEMRRALEEDPSEIRSEICAIGYRRCTNDMISLTHLVNEESKDANLIRRWRLKRTRKQAVEALSRARESFPPGALKATRQEK